MIRKGILTIMISSFLLISCKKEVKTDDSQILKDSTTTSSKENSFSKKDLIGDWITGEYQSGFQLNEDGTAKSINTATLRYSKWELKGNLLLLNNISIGNRTSSLGVDSLHLESLVNNELKLKPNTFDSIFVYKRPSKDVKLEYYTFPADTIIK
jgi:hypothetical protein